jgi:DNA-binding NtrC family response regulator
MRERSGYVCRMVRQFIIIDDNRDERFVLSRALFCHYPAATLHEHREFDSARDALVKLPGDGGQAVVLLHRIPGAEGVGLIRAMRELHGQVTMIALGDPADARKALEAGATQFLDYEAWLRLGTLIKGLENTLPNLTEKSSS